MCARDFEGEAKTNLVANEGLKLSSFEHEARHHRRQRRNGIDSAWQSRSWNNGLPPSSVGAAGAMAWPGGRAANRAGCIALKRLAQ